MLTEVAESGSALTYEPSALHPPTSTPASSTLSTRCLAQATELGAVQRALQHADIECAGSLMYVPLSTVEVSAEHEADNFAVIDKLEELDDVTNVEHNMVVS